MPEAKSSLVIGVDNPRRAVALRLHCQMSAQHRFARAALLRLDDDRLHYQSFLQSFNKIMFSLKNEISLLMLDRRRVTQMG